MRKQNRLMVIQVAGLGYDFALSRSVGNAMGLEVKPMDTVFPALTCPVQASFRTGLAPVEHGITANGFFSREFKRTFFWEQSAALIGTRLRIWDDFRSGGGRVGMMFWQNSLGEDLDLVVSPAPVHLHGGGLVQALYSVPSSVGKELEKAIGRGFDLAGYWGPFAGERSSAWIAEAAAQIVSREDIAPGLLMVYLPALDYDLQRYGPDSAQAGKAARKLLDELALLRKAASEACYEVVIFGDYAIHAVDRGAIFPNIMLRQAGLFRTRKIRRMEYPDFFSSPAFAVVDHEIAHVYVADLNLVSSVRRLYEGAEGISTIYDRRNAGDARMFSARCGELILVAGEGRWFAYPWTEAGCEAPDYAGHVDIHNKPGYDPCELFLGWPPGTVSRNPDRIKGSHGRTGPDSRVALASSMNIPDVSNLTALAAFARDYIGTGQS